ncbi:hypothetical protein [Mycolicibacterium sp. A43C]
MNNVIMISGDRQAGKTHAALSIAALDAVRGQSVVYTAGGGWRYISHAHHDLLAAYIPPDLVESQRNGQGHQQIKLVGGGEIRYMAGPGGREITAGVDTFIFDDVDLPPDFAELHPKSHIYVTELTGAAAHPDQRAAALIRAARVFVHGEETCPMPPAGRSKAHCVFAGCPVHGQK